MHICAHRDLVVPSLNRVVAGGGVPRGHVLDGELDGHRLRRARRKFTGLGVASELDSRLLDAAVRKRSGEVHLHHVLTGDVTGVGDGHVNLHGVLGDDGLSRLPREVRVAQAVTEGELHRLLVASLVIGPPRLVVAVAHVDALLVVEERARGVGVVVVSQVHGTRSRRHVIRVGVGEVSRGVDLAREDLGQRRGALGSGGTDPHGGGDLGVLVEEAQLELVARVHDHDHVVLHGGDLVQQLALLSGELEVFLREVRALGARDAHGHDGGVGEILRLG